MSTREADICVIGAGLVGCFSALFLAQRGFHVILLDKGMAGREASGTSFGTLRMQGRHPAKFPLAVLSHAAWEQFTGLTGEQCGYQRSGHSYLALDSSENARIDQYAREAAEAGLNVEVLSGKAARRRWPLLSERVTRASWSPRDGISDPRLTGPAVARGAARQGATILENTAVTAIVPTNPGFRVETRAGVTLICDKIVNAAGAWSGQFARSLGEPVPMFPAGPPIVETEARPLLGITSFLCIDGSIILRQHSDGRFWIASLSRQQADLVAGNATVPQERVASIMRRLAEICPSLAELKPVRAWSGVEGYLPDMMPVIGPSSTTPGVVHAFGMSCRGYQIAPGVGHVVAELVTKGRSAIAIDEFAISRFAGRVKTHKSLFPSLDPVTMQAIRQR
ncbi:MAG: FAD-binding oxidoreductase [Hyphomicrobiaceae bacterium]|nr:MAG: FAD-binding oxidoreductase [Hyphomicrobiaceae bacterium]